MSAPAADSTTQSLAAAAQTPAGRDPYRLLRRFAVKGVLWRNYLDFAVRNVPFYLQPVLLWCWTVLFFFLAAPARRAVVGNLGIIQPGSSLLVNHLRAFRTLVNFAWTIAEAASYRVTKA